MKADTLDLTKLFAGAVRYLVPIFQRPYVWRQEDHWGPLWEDVRVVTEAQLRRQALEQEGAVASDVAPHFLGAIVLDQVLNPTGTIEARYVIDGQQRLTTLQLFLSAAREVAIDCELETAKTRLERLIFNPDDLIEGPSDQRFKVWPTLRDRAAFVEVMDRHGELPEETHHAGHRMDFGETYFRSQIQAWIEEGEAGAEQAERMKALTTVISRMLKIVAIDLEPNDNAQVIFETLNARGTPLLASDLVKNLIFQRAAESGGDGALEALYDNHWKQFDSDHWLQRIRQGRLNRPRVEVFLFHWLTMKTQEEIPATRLFQTFKGLLDVSDVSVEEALAEFARDGQIFDRLDRHEYGSRVQRFFERLNTLDTTTLLPITLWLFRQPDDTFPDERRLRAIEILESWLVRRAVVRLTTRNYNRFFLDLLGPLKESPAEADTVLLERLRAEEVDSQYWPKDDEFLDALCTTPLYGSINQRRVRLLLLALEERMRQDARLGEQIPVGRTFHIEHVLPQSWEEHWPLPDDAPPEAREHRDLAKHRLGNLTLVTNQLNPSMSNGPWLSKRSALDEHSVLMLNRQLLRDDPPVWDEDGIRARGRELGELSLRIWPGPDDSYWLG